MEEVKPKSIKFIKLGRGGVWEKECIEGNKPMIRLGFNNPHHTACLNGHWDFIRKYWGTIKSKGKATEITNQIRDFYTLSSSTMWITFFKRKLHWCFAEPTVRILKDGSRIRNAIGKWYSTDISGANLFVENISGNLAKVQGFRGTICSVKEQEYLVKKINCQTLPEVTCARESLENLIENIKPLIQSLGWKDFELLIDLIFSQAGWQRIATLGKVEKSIDLDLMSPVTGKRAFVQVKSQSNISALQDYISQFKSMGQYDEMYYVVHTATASLASLELPSNVQVMDVSHISKLTVNSGLVNWLITKAS